MRGLVGEQRRDDELAGITGRGVFLAEYDAAAWRATDAVKAAHPVEARVRRYIARNRRGMGGGFRFEAVSAMQRLSDTLTTMQKPQLLPNCSPDVGKQAEAQLTSRMGAMRKKRKCLRLKR